MKDFCTAVIWIMVIKGLIYVFLPDQVERMGALIQKTPRTELIAFGMLLLFCAFWAWVAVVRYMPD